MDPIRVLLVGGKPALVNLVRLFLEQQEDIDVVGACNSVEESRDYAANPRPQVVVTDLGTPGLTGLEAIRRLRKIMPGAGIVATSLLSANGYWQVARSAGADEVVAQAELSTHLLPAIRRAAQREQPVTLKVQKTNRRTEP